LLWEPEIDATWARIICRDLESRGLDPCPVLKKAGIRERDIVRDDGRVPIARSDALFEFAAELAGDDLFGLKLGSKTDPREFGLLAYVGLNSRSLIDAVRNLARYVRVFTDRFSVRLEPEPEGLLVHAVMDGSTDLTARHANEAGLIALLSAYRLFSGRNLSPREVCFRHSRKTGLKEFERAFGCPVNFQSARTGFLLRRKDLEIPLATADDQLLNLLRRYCEEVLSRRKVHDPPFIVEVCDRIADLLPKGRARAKNVADELGMSSRTFLRRLKASGTSFRDLEDGLRRELAEAYLADPELSAKEIAFLLGYSSSSAFSHGFRRLTGKSPAEFRNSRSG